jgi:hypothetical protein
MWRLAVSELSNRTIYKGQKILYMGTIKAQVTSVYIAGERVHSAFFSTETRPIFRSESARFVLFIQMSREMWDFDSEGSGEINFSKVVNGFLPTLFKRWASIKARHLVSIVLFSRVEYDPNLNSELASSLLDSEYYTGVQSDGSRKPYKDFYRVVVSEMGSGEWTVILTQLKREFRSFRRDITLHRQDMAESSSDAPFGDPKAEVLSGTRLDAEPSLAMHGNILEAINLAAAQFSHDHIDRDLVRTGLSIILITAGNGLFEVEHDQLKMTTESLTGNGIGIDLVCLPKMPLHSVPLFRYRNPRYKAYHEQIQMKSVGSEQSTPRQGGVFGSFSSIGEQLSPSKSSAGNELTQRLSALANEQEPDEWNFAIPHWIDVSYWTGASQDLESQAGGKKWSHQGHTTSRRSGFAVRCKMYEMEMASIIRNGHDEIMIPVLHQERGYSQKFVSPKALMSSDSRKTGELNAVNGTQHHLGLSEVVHGSSRSVLEKLYPAEHKDFYRALAMWDESRARNLKPVESNTFNQETRKKTKKVEASVNKALEEGRKIYSTSLGDNFDSSKGLRLADAAMAERRLEDLKKPLVEKPRQTSISSAASKSTTVTPNRPVRFGRQISLGFRGFGIAAPKAATAELQIEHVNAAMSPSVTPAGFELSKPISAKPTPMTSPALVATRHQGSPSSSHIEKSLKKVDSHDTEKFWDKDKIPQTQPIAIKSALQSLESNTLQKSRSILGSVYEGKDQHASVDEIQGLQKIKSSDSQKMYNARLLAGSIPELPAVLSPTTALAPWLTVLNPSNPTLKDADVASQYKRWQHVFPRPRRNKAMKWKSMCSPASVPLTTEYFPTKHQLTTEYLEKPYNISQNGEDELNEVPKTREEFLRELVSMRLSHGFQIVTGPAVALAFGQPSMNLADVFDRDTIAEDGASIFLSMGNTIHQLSCTNETEVEIHTFTRKPTAPSNDDAVNTALYKPAIRTTLDEGYFSREIKLRKSVDKYNWNYVDSFVAGHEEDYNDMLKFWRARFVLIPVERPSQNQRHQGEDNEEEVRLEGIRKLTQMWQRHRYFPPSERRFQNLTSRQRKDPNPLDIVYQTQDPSVVVAAELDTLPLVEGDTGGRRQLLSRPEPFRKSNLNVTALADAIQASVEKGGIRMQNRRWHLRLHYNCFIGSDMTTWLLENFDDIESREEAVELGQMLTKNADTEKKGKEDSGKDIGKDPTKEDKDKDVRIFVHVEKRHDFRDGQYFYQMTSEFAKARNDNRGSSWFGSRRREPSVPPTPISESFSRESPRPERSRSSSGYDEKYVESGTTTPTTSSSRPRVALSKVMRYDVDHRRRSYRPERINLHYDRLHNPDNCYHIRIDWMNVTAKLIEDAIASWAKTAEQYGLRLVEAPIREASSITTVHPFRRPYTITLALQPPQQAPNTTYFDATSFAPQVQSCRHFYQKAILRRHNFVLDTEAARNFPNNVEVVYSWGKPDYKYTQYIHRSGVLLVQITDEGNFLLLANRLYNNRTAALREQDRFMQPHHLERMPQNRMASAMRETPRGSPVVRPYINSPVLRASSDVLGAVMAGSKVSALITPESIKDDLERLCLDADKLELFYREVRDRAGTVATPLMGSIKSPSAMSAFGPGNGAGIGEGSIPSLGLGPGLLSGLTGSSGWGLGREGREGKGPVRRGSAHPSDADSGRDSPRLSIAE